MIEASTAFINALKSPTKEFFIKMELYNKDMVFLEEVTRQVVSSDLGSLSIDRSRPIRRSFTFSLDNTDGSFTWGEDKKIWIDKYIKLYTGLKLPNGDIDYIQQGVFIVSEPQDSHDMNGKRVTINGKDKAFRMTDKRGKFLYQTTIATGTNIGTAIRTIANGAGESMFNFDDIIETVPYELTFEPNESRWDAIDQLAQLGKSEVFYDVHGYLRLKRIDLNDFTNYPPVWSYKYNDAKERFYAGNVRTMDESNLANHIFVLGGSGQTATVQYELKVTETNSLWVNSPYSIEKIGDVVYFHNNASPDSLLTTVDECKWRAKFELMNRLGYSERVSLNVAPMYLQDVSDIIEIVDSENNVNGRYLIETINMPLQPQLMSIECRKERRVISDWSFI